MLTLPPMSKEKREYVIANTPMHDAKYFQVLSWGIMRRKLKRMMNRSCKEWRNR